MAQEKHVHRIVRQLGTEAITSELSVSTFSVKAAKSAGLFPARWYAPLKRLCDEQGIPIPLSAFNWLDPDKKPVSPSVGSEPGDVQGPSSKEVNA